MTSTIIRDRLNHRARVLRVRWHADGDALLKSAKYLDFTEGLLRLMRQLDAITAAVERLPQSDTYGFASAHGATSLAAGGVGSVRPTRGPTNSLA